MIKLCNFVTINYSFYKKVMKKYILYSLFISLSIAFFACEGAGNKDAVITGQVTDVSTGDPIADATVAITSPAEHTDFSKTDELGKYELDGININDVTDISITASATNFISKSRNLTVAPEDVQSNVNFELLSEDAEDDGGGEDGGEVSGKPAGAAAIILESISADAINIRQTGGNISSRFVFSVVDSAGRAIDTEGAVDVSFSILKGPGGGETVIPSKVRTNAEGKVVTSLFSGDSAGVVRVRAIVDRQDVGITVISDPILVAINGGFPSPDRFFVGSINTNLEGFGIISDNNAALEYPIVASVGDKFGNPVKVGTAVDFRTVGAAIIEGSALTDDFGSATVKLRPDGSRPTSHPDGAGYFNVIAKTVDENNNFVSRELRLLFTSSAASITINPTSVNIPSGGSQSFSYTVTDINGNPMAAGTNIGVSVATGIGATGDVGFTLGDFTQPGPGRTEFGFTVSDTDDESSDEVGTSITISVQSAATKSTTSLTIQGTRAKTGGWNFNSSSAKKKFIPRY